MLSRNRTKMSSQDIQQYWQIRCPKCGRSKPLDKLGGFRGGAASKGKRTLAHCSECKKLRWAIVEKVSNQNLM